VRQGDTLREPKILSGDHLARFHCVLANPPFSLEQWGATEWKNDLYRRNIYGTPNDSNGDYAWIQHMVASMKPVVGRMAVVLPQGVLFRGDTEQRIREKLIREDKIEAVVTLGDKLFYGTGLSPCFLALRAQKPTAHVNRILMVDGTKILTKRRAQNVLEESDVDRLYELYHNYRDEEDFARVVTNEDVLKKDCNLSPNRYIHYHQAERESYDEVLAQFKAAVERVNKAEAAYRRTMA
jgi:type I restriction enzyme M protein